MSFLSPTPGVGVGLSVLTSPGNLQLALFTSPAPEKPGREAQQAVREHRLSLERLLDEACLSQNGASPLLPDALVLGRLAKGACDQQSLAPPGALARAPGAVSISRGPLGSSQRPPPSSWTCSQTNPRARHTPTGQARVPLRSTTPSSWRCASQNWRDAGMQRCNRVNWPAARRCSFHLVCVVPVILSQAAADSLAAKLQEQLMPWLKQQVQEALAGAKGNIDLQTELAGMNAKLQTALSQEVRGCHNSRGTALACWWQGSLAAALGRLGHTERQEQPRGRSAPLSDWPRHGCQDSAVWPGTAGNHDSCRQLHCRGTAHHAGQAAARHAGDVDGGQHLRA
jgi:hypothetical protein